MASAPSPSTFRIETEWFARTHIDSLVSLGMIQPASHVAHCTPTLAWMGTFTRYWIEFDWPEEPRNRGPHGFGATAIDLEDALALIRREWFVPQEQAEPAVLRVVENVDASQLDLHVRPNMHPPNWRGVWYPRLRPLS